MKEAKSLDHTKWDCKYHVVFIPKRSKKAVYGAIRQYLGSIPERSRSPRDQRFPEESVFGKSCGR
jgi:putative transposase